MEVINTTCASVTLDLTTIAPPSAQKAGRLVAKVTFNVRRDGSLELVSDDPFPVLRADVETSSGVIPADTGAFTQDGVEVIVNSMAYAPAGKPARSVEVSVAVGDMVHRAIVTGDRQWIGVGPDARPSEPVPFVRMPLTYERAFGGTAEVWLDEKSSVPVPCAANPRGRGFDPQRAIRAFAEFVGTPATFPRVDPTRLLPNIEDPRERIETWYDAPRPYCWSARPMDVVGPVAIPAEPEAPAEPNTPPAWLPEAEHVRSIRCHPDLFQSQLAPGTLVRLVGMTPEGDFAFLTPSNPVGFDYEIDGRTGRVGCQIRRLMILPDERRCALTYEARFRFSAARSGTRSLRMRIAES